MPDATSHIRVICLRAGSDFLHSITLYSEPYTIIWVIWLTSDIHFNECWVRSEQHATCRVFKELIYLCVIPEKKYKYNKNTQTVFLTRIKNLINTISQISTLLSVLLIRTQGRCKVSVWVKEQYFLLHWLFCSCVLGCAHLPVRQQAEYSTSSSDDEFESKPSVIDKVTLTWKQRYFLGWTVFMIHQMILI